MTADDFQLSLARFPDEATLLHCLRQIAARPGLWEQGLAVAMSDPEFSLERHFCEGAEDGPYLEQVKIGKTRAAFDYGTCFGGCCGEGCRYYFRLPGYLLDEERTGSEGWIH